MLGDKKVVEGPVEGPVEVRDAQKLVMELGDGAFVLVRLIRGGEECGR